MQTCGVARRTDSALSGETGNFPLFDEGPHDVDAHVHSVRALEHIRRHQCAMLGEGERPCSGELEAGEVVTICDHLGLLGLCKHRRENRLGKDDRYLRPLRCQVAKLREECEWRGVATSLQRRSRGGRARSNSQTVVQACPGLSVIVPENAINANPQPS
jgi:hypothetical protein